MKLFIAEKPSLARAIAEVMPGPVKKQKDHILCSNGDVIAWCAGHILEQAPPDAYNKEYEKWHLHHLPIVPSDWLLSVSNAGLYKTLKGLIKKANSIVNAGDPDREGQLLVDEVIEHVGSNLPVERILISDYNPDAVRKALAAIESNDRFSSLSDSALARSRADWLYGMNMTRLYTLLGRNNGYDGVLSVGRVQTPLLGLIVRRDLEIENFQPKPYFTIKAQIKAGQGSFSANWKPGKNAEPHLDEDNRLLNEAFANKIVAATQGKTGQIIKCDQTKKNESAPLPYSLADLQKDAAKKFDMEPADTLDAAQALYETHRLTTYPRSDCSYLPDGHFSDGQDVIAAIKNNWPEVSSWCEKTDLSIRSRAWNDKKVTAHHAIIPTVAAANISSLSEQERQIYQLVVRRYIAQFFPKYEYMQTKIEAVINNELFTASGRQPLTQGWRVLFGKDNQDEKEEDEASSLPIIKQGESVEAQEVKAEQKKTQPPKRFASDTLVEAMEGISRFVSDPTIKKQLKESEGIGTPATQASIIQTLFDRDYVTKKGKQVISTQTGRTLIQILPDMATKPDMTAFWEAAMRKIVDREMSLEDFLRGVERQLSNLISHGKQQTLKIPGVQAHPCPKCKTPIFRRKGKNDYFWPCPNDSCDVVMDDFKGKPEPRITTKYKCPGEGCPGQFSRKKGKDSYFWGCSEYKNGCKQSMDDLNGKPVPRKPKQSRRRKGRK